ncbi:cAMP-responsive element modulator isoform X1 [Dunckerocampus dactyliophorus]|uniref:cAMP-responsive element modulator isoform X1 n=1 Tax=Dunckerocampus dactyliophorus TaxID=161453 RepID=UPI002406CFB2|nr:cAMP-responsive element modulator isoform X1 [Dunckerocampus dactyliophorus]
MDDSSLLDDSVNGSDQEEEEKEENQDGASPFRVSPSRRTQTSVIQSPQAPTHEVTSGHKSEGDTHKRRELLSRRPSYRKILKELSLDSPAVAKIDEEEEEEEAAVANVNSSSTPTIYQTSSGQYISIAQGRTIQLSATGAQALHGGQSLTPQPGATILQCAASPGDAPQQFFIQGGQMLIQAATGDIPAYQLRSPNTGLGHSIVMAPSPSATQSPSSQHAEEITRKREVRLMKNREAARECRRKKKEYVKCLENRVAVLENQNKTLIEELKALKDIYCHKAE